MSYDGETPDPVYRGDTYDRGVQPALPHVITGSLEPLIGTDLRDAYSNEGLMRRVVDSAREEGWRRVLN